MLRTLLAAGLAGLLALSSAAPHVHTGPLGDHDCPACVAHGARPAEAAAPDLVPAEAPRYVRLAPSPVEAPPAGAPLGAVPGQSPPAGA